MSERIPAAELVTGDVLVPDLSIRRVAASKGQKAMSYMDGANTSPGVVTNVEVQEGNSIFDKVAVTFSDNDGKEHVKMFCRGQNVLVDR